jgi:hypothetical protein
MTSRNNIIATRLAAAGLAAIAVAGASTSPLAAMERVHQARTYDSRVYHAWAALRAQSAARGLHAPRRVGPLGRLLRAHGSHDLR